MPEIESKPTADLARIIDSAKRLGVELDEEEALQWLAAMSGSKSGGDVVLDVSHGVFGHKISMLDFSPAELAYYRQIGQLVEFQDEPGVVETALALSGSAAQSKIQSFPGDADFFERVNISAPSREDACTILARIMRDKALNTLSAPTYQLIEVKFGSYPCDVVRGERKIKAGSPIGWLPGEIQAGRINAADASGAPVEILWDQVALNSGWCKLDWVVADPVRGQLSNASNMLDVTWQSPDGAITPLDGYLDPYFQEVYLDAASIPIFSKLARHVSANALDDYVVQLEREVQKYLTKDINYGKAAKRMYNIFRLTGHYEEAVFIRELFDEPATILYQVWSLIRTVDDAAQPGCTIAQKHLLGQIDRLILDVIKALEGDQEAEIVRQLLRLRDSLTRQEMGQELTVEAEQARAQVINIVNNFFHDRLVALPTIQTYMHDHQGQH